MWWVLIPLFLCTLLSGKLLAMLTLLMIRWSITRTRRNVTVRTFWSKTIWARSRRKWIRKWRKPQRNSVTLSMRLNSVRRILVYWSIKRNGMRSMSVIARRWTSLTSRIFANWSWIARSFARFPELVTGRRFASLTWCSLRIWVLPLMERLRFIFVRRRLKVFSWTSWMCRRLAVWRSRSVSPRSVRRSVMRSWLVSLSSVCASSSKWRCNSSFVRVRRSSGSRNGSLLA